MKIVQFPTQPRPRTLKERLALAEAQIMDLKQTLALSLETMPGETYELFRLRLARERRESSASNTSCTPSLELEALIGGNG